LLALTAFGNAQTGAGGWVYTKHFAYFLEAPKGWVMDAGDAAKENVGAVFHLVNAHWPESRVIVYTICEEKSKVVHTVADRMRADVALFKKDGSTVQVTKKPPIKSDMEGKLAEVYHFSGDKRGQLEARAYFDDKNYINYFVLTAHDKATFEKSLPEFDFIVRSYRPASKVIWEKAPNPPKT
jgi:hypothetical protein